MTSRSMESEIKELKKQQNVLVKQVKVLKEKIEKLEEDSIIKLKPMIKDHSTYQDFYNRQEWLEDQRKQYPNELLAYTKKDEGYLLLAHSKTESDLLKQIDTLLENNTISQEDIVLFDS